MIFKRKLWLVHIVLLVHGSISGKSPMYLHFLVRFATNIAYNSSRVHDFRRNPCLYEVGSLFHNMPSSYPILSHIPWWRTVNPEIPWISKVPLLAGQAPWRWRSWRRSSKGHGGAAMGGMCWGHDAPFRGSRATYFQVTWRIYTEFLCVYSCLRRVSTWFQAWFFFE